MDGAVRLDLDDRIARLVIDRPPANALTVALVGDLFAAVDRVDKAASVRAAVLTGAGGTFCGGTDLKALGALEPKALLQAAQQGQDVAWKIEHSEKVWIAAVEGVARGGGLDLALACDLLIAAEDARFESPEVGEGWIPIFGGTQRLRLAAGRTRAREAILAGEPITARDGEALGFVTRVAPKGRAAAVAEEIARKVASRPWAAVRAAKRVLVEQMDKPYRNGFLLEAQHFAQLVMQRKAPPSA